MGSFVVLIELLVTLGVGFHLISQYLIVNNLWSRRGVREAAESISISAALLGLATSLPFLVHFLFVASDMAGAARTGISILTGLFFVLLGTGFCVTEHRGKGDWTLLGGALKREGRESADLLKSRVQPTGAAQLIAFFEAMASVDKHIDAREIDMIEQFARRWRVDPPQLQEGET